MTINGRALALADGIGAVLQTGLALLLQFGQFFVLRAAWAATPAVLPGLAEYNVAIAALACLCGGITDLLVGLVYAFQHSGRAALGGALAGALARLISGVLGLGVSLLLM